MTYKAAILGSENTHAVSFAKELLAGYLPDVTLIGAFGTDEAANQVLRDMGVPFVTTDPYAFVGKVDLCIITARHGDLHHTYGMPYLKAGTAMWIDKPLCVSLALAQEMVDVAKATNTPISGGSFVPRSEGVQSIKMATQTPNNKGEICGGTVVAPIRSEAEYGGFYFYAQHLIEIVLEIFGENVKSVFASQGPDGFSGIMRYDAFDVCCLYHEKNFHYDVCVCMEEGSEVCHLTPSDIAKLHFHSLDDMAYMLKEGHPRRPYETLLHPLRILRAMGDAIGDGQFHDISAY